jgi:DNA primase small subunit
MDDLLFSFSGGKGFHIRVAGQQHLDKYARANIQEYISGHKVEKDAIFNTLRVERAMPELHLRENITGGWTGKVTKFSWHYIELLDRMPHSEVVEELKEKWPRHTTGPKKGQKKKCAGKTVERMATNLKTNMGILKRNGNLTSTFDRKKNDVKNFTDILLQSAVTKDTKKQLRIPGSFHGGSGMACAVIDYDDLRSIKEVLDTAKAAVGTRLTSFTLEKPIQTHVGKWKPGNHEAPLCDALIALCAERNSR